MRARIRHDRRRGAHGRGRCTARPLIVARVLQIDRRERVAVEDQRAVRAGQLDAARIARVRRRRRFERAERTIRELEDGHGRVFDLDRMQQRAGLRRHAAHRSKQPEKQIDGVDPLVHQRTAAVERLRAAPPRLLVVRRRPVPFHARVGENRRAEPPAVDQRLHPQHVRLEAILKDHAERHASARRFGDERVNSGRRHIDRLLDEHVQPPPRGGDAVLRMQPGRTADHDEVERPMVEKPIERIERGGAVPAGKPFGVRVRRRDDGRHFHSRNVAKRARVRVADVAGADQPDVHGRQSVIRNP